MRELKMLAVLMFVVVVVVWFILQLMIAIAKVGV